MSRQMQYLWRGALLKLPQQCCQDSLVPLQYKGHVGEGLRARYHESPGDRSEGPLGTQPPPHVRLFQVLQQICRGLLPANLYRPNAVS